MNWILTPLLLFCGIGAAIAETISVTVGNTGCRGRQVSVSRLWEKIPGVQSVTVSPRKPESPAAQRVFVIVSETASPTESSLRKALGRRAKHFPIVKSVSEPALPD